MVYTYKPKSYTKKTIVTGGAYAEVSEVVKVKKEEQENKKDKLKNVSITKSPVNSKISKISQDKLNKFVNLKLN